MTGTPIEEEHGEAIRKEILILLTQFVIINGEAIQPDEITEAAEEKKERERERLERLKEEEEERKRLAEEAAEAEAEAEEEDED